jgi:hypothetical protein
MRAPAAADFFQDESGFRLALADQPLVHRHSSPATIEC